MLPLLPLRRSDRSRWNTVPVFALVAIVILLIVLVLLLSISAGPTPVLAARESEKRILTTIDEMVRSRENYANVPPADGRLLRLLAETIDAKTVVEIGTSTGISGLWLCLALQTTEGNLTTFEIDASRAASARRRFAQAGVNALVTVNEGDAHRNLSSVAAPVDLAFIDAEKQGYLDYLNQLLPMVRPGGLILAHNVDMVPEYLAAVKRNPDLETVIFNQGAGMAVTLKKR